MNSTTIKFTHHIGHGYDKMYNPTTITLNTTDKSITAHLDLNSVHDHHRYGKYICTTSASLLSKPDKIYSDSRDLTVRHMAKKHIGNYNLLFHALKYKLYSFYSSINFSILSAKFC